MKFRINSMALLSRLQVMSRVVDSKGFLPVLSCLLLQWDNQKLTITAFNGEIRLVTWLPVEEVDESGAICVNLRILLSGIKGLPDQPILFDINLGNDEVSVHYKDGVFQFVGLPAVSFPEASPLEVDALQAALDAPQLLRMVSKTIIATGTDEYHPALMGILFDVDGDSLSAVATDSQQMVVLRQLHPMSVVQRSFILNRKAAALLKVILPGVAGAVALQYDRSKVRMTMDGYELIAKLILEKYPNYRMVMANQYDIQVHLDRSSFLSLIRRVSCFSGSSSQWVKLSFETGKVQASAEDIEVSISGNEEMSCDYLGAPMSVGFKSNFLLDFLSNLDTPEVVLAMNSPTMPVLILPNVDQEQEELKQLLMPIALPH